ncbi:Tat pathway signal sequence domain protein [Sphingomonas deserti]|uniref:Tat pathway signal sequence domain protein n=1 Tax=Allosphingosinicella deserti TaxID=2116704 RepID=A0A2P7QME5_9SPHN|nr:Tat pathway signal sequence domain protein [Sphingomonas deserti]
MTRRAFVAGATALAAGCATTARSGGVLLHEDDFRDGLGQWVVEAEQGGAFRAEGGVLDIDSPAGVTLWFRHAIEGPVAIDYDVEAVAAGGPNDQVSDINCFWMATDKRAPGGDVLAVRRSGAFADYDELRTYYAGIGGNRNTTSRFRRYIGRRDERPLLPQHDLSAPAHFIEPNRRYRIRLIADGRRVELQRDGRTMFLLDDPEPYTRGHFALRTTKSHLRVRDFRVSRLTR